MHDFLCGLTGEIVTPFHPIYNKARQGYNKAIQKYPIIINYCSTKVDVSNAVCWAKRHCIPIRIRSGGHNYEGYSNGNCVLVIDISRLNDMYIDTDSNLLHVESGVTNQQVYGLVSSFGYPFPGGTCPSVGVSGYCLGGGWGLSCRNYGLGCDSLTEIELIDYEGNLIHANGRVNEDLFWALRGAGGGNFGIVVAMTFQLPQKVDFVTLIEIDYLNVSEIEQEQFLSVWQNWLSKADDRMTLLGRVYQSERDGRAMLLRGIFYGEPEEANLILTDFLSLPNAVYNIEAVTFLEAITIIGSVYPPFERFQSVSGFVIQELSEEEIKSLVQIIQEPPNGSVFAGISLYALGGKVSDVGTNDTAFFYRNAKYMIWLETVWEKSEFAQVNREWIAKNYQLIRCLTIGSYVNFPYDKLEHYLEEYFGFHVNQLKRIKTKYDPCNTFSYPQGIFAESEEESIDCVPYDASPKDEGIEQPIDLNYRGFRYVTKK